MASAVTTAVSSFAQAVANVGFAILNASIAVFHAVISLFSEIATGVLQIAQAVVKLFTDLIQDTVGFIFTNFFLVLVLGGAYYWYTNSQGNATRRGKKKAL